MTEDPRIEAVADALCHDPRERVQIEVMARCMLQVADAVDPMRSRLQAAADEIRRWDSKHPGTKSAYWISFVGALERALAGGTSPEPTEPDSQIVDRGSGNYSARYGWLVDVAKWEPSPCGRTFDDYQTLLSHQNECDLCRRELGLL